MTDYLAHFGRCAITGIFGGAACALVLFLIGEANDRRALARLA